MPGAVALCTIAIAGAEVWTSGELSPLYHRASNGTWDSSRPLYTGSIRALVVAGDSLWLAGDAGAVLRRSIPSP